MKKILIFAPTSPTSGITQYILNMLSAFNTDEIKFDILSFKNHRLKAWCDENGTEYFEFNISPYKQRKEYKAFLKNVFSRGYDVVYYNASTISELQIFKSAKKYSNAKLIMHSHACAVESQSKLIYTIFTYLHKLLRIFANKYFYKKCACSEVASEWMYGKKGAQDVIFLSNAIDIDEFKFNKASREDLRQSLGIKTKYVIGHVGRFAPPKNHSFILDAFKKLTETNDNCTLVLVGQGELETTIKQKIKDLSLEEKVILVDFQEDIYKYYSLFDLFFMPSLFEAFPITLIEAQASGLVALVSDVVTKDSDITGLLEFMSLDDGADKWATKMNTKLKKYDRLNYVKDFEEKGFSLQKQVKILSKLFED